VDTTTFTLTARQGTQSFTINNMQEPGAKWSTGVLRRNVRYWRVNTKLSQAD